MIFNVLRLWEKGVSSSCSLRQRIGCAATIFGLLSPPLLLLQTGGWVKATGCKEGEPMPNSAGCVHTYPDRLRELTEALQQQCAVEARPNTDGNGCPTRIPRRGSRWSTR